MPESPNLPTRLRSYDLEKSRRQLTFRAIESKLMELHESSDIWPSTFEINTDGIDLSVVGAIHGEGLLRYAAPYKDGIRNMSFRSIILPPDIPNDQIIVYAVPDAIDFINSPLAPEFLTIPELIQYVQRQASALGETSSVDLKEFMDTQGLSKNVFNIIAWKRPDLLALSNWKEQKQGISVGIFEKKTGFYWQYPGKDVLSAFENDDAEKVPIRKMYRPNVPISMMHFRNTLVSDVPSAKHMSEEELSDYFNTVMRFWTSFSHVYILQEGTSGQRWKRRHGVRKFSSSRNEV